MVQARTAPQPAVSDSGEGASSLAISASEGMMAEFLGGA